MNDVYQPPLEYDDIKKINLKFIPPNEVCIEGNKKFKSVNSVKGYEYFDTVLIGFPEKSFEFVNRLYIQFEDSKGQDSIYLVVSKSGADNIYYKQIFLSSVIVINLNDFSADNKSFRIDTTKLVSKKLLENNDTLIYQVVDYFNINSDTLRLSECGRNCNVLIDICRFYNLPCRILYLQGGDADIVGYLNQIGYPTHVLCEIYSSRFQKWYVIDPTYGLRFREEGTEDFMSAVEISNKYYFQREKEIIQDSTLATKRTTVGRDYFKYYENIYYDSDYKPNFFLEKYLQYFYADFNYWTYVFANNTPLVKNGKNYLILKSLMYLFLTVLLANYFMITLTRRLMLSKKPKEAAKKL